MLISAAWFAPRRAELKTRFGVRDIEPDEQVFADQTAQLGQALAAVISNFSTASDVDRYNVSQAIRRLLLTVERTGDPTLDLPTAFHAHGLTTAQAVSDRWLQMGQDADQLLAFLKTPPADP